MGTSALFYVFLGHGWELPESFLELQPQVSFQDKKKRVDGRYEVIAVFGGSDLRFQL